MMKTKPDQTFDIITIAFYRRKQSPVKIAKSVNNVSAAEAQHNASTQQINSTKQRASLQPQQKPSQKKRGRSLTRQPAISGKTTHDEISRTNQSREDNAQRINKAKSSPSKHVSRQLSSTPKPTTPNGEKIQQLHLKYDENEPIQVGSRNSSNHNSVTSSREATPKISSSSRESGPVERPGKEPNSYQYVRLP